MLTHARHTRTHTQLREENNITVLQSWWWRVESRQSPYPPIHICPYTYILHTYVCMYMNIHVCARVHECPRTPMAPIHQVNRPDIADRKLTKPSIIGEVPHPPIRAEVQPTQLAPGGGQAEHILAPRGKLGQVHHCAVSHWVKGELIPQSLNLATVSRYSL